MNSTKRIQYIMIALSLFFLAGIVLYNTFSTPAFLPNPQVYERSEAVKANTPVAGETQQNGEWVDEQIPVPKNNDGDLNDEKPVVGSIVNINTASLAELMTLKGVGEVKAQAILDYRAENGGFSAPEELMNVKGIGQKTFENIAPYITT